MSWVEIEKRMLSLIGKGFRVCSYKSSFTKDLVGWYICTNWGERAVYLWKDGTINGSTGYCSPGFGVTLEDDLKALHWAPGYWGTKEEAEAFLEAWKNEKIDECDTEERVPESV